MTEESIAHYELESRIVSRGSPCKELHFMRKERRPVIPVYHGGQLIVCEWGSWSRSKLPRSGLCSVESLEAGQWRWCEPQRVEIPADFGFEKGIWYQITQGVQGMLVHDERGKPHVYLLTKQATHYYEIMTRCSRMPVLIDQEI
jgi:hypothetical protein